MIETHCLPVILYAIESLDIKGAELKEMNAWWNSVYRRIFGYNKWESVKKLISELGRLNLLHLVNLRRMLFIKRLLLTSNSVMSALMYYYVHGPELQEIESKYGTKLWWSAAKIKALIFVSFRNMCVDKTS